MCFHRNGTYALQSMRLVYGLGVELTRLMARESHR